MTKRLYYEFFYYHSIPEMLLWGLLLVILWTVLAVYCTRRHPRLWMNMNRAVLVVTVIFILYWTVWKREAGAKQELSLIPLHSFIEAKNQPELYREVVANILLFTPLGLSAPFVVNTYLHQPVLVTIISAVVLSAAIEMIQYIFSLGLCETDDVVFNTCGAAIGCLAFTIARFVEKLRQDIPN